MKTETDYGVLRALATFLSAIGWIVIAIGGVIFIVGLTSGLAYRNSLSSVGMVGGFLSGLSLAATGLLIVAIGQAISVFIDIAVNTAPIAQLVQYNAAMVALFEHIKNKNPAQDAVTTAAAAKPRPDRPVDQGTFEGLSWWSYPDGHVVAKVGGEHKTFPSGPDFMNYAYSLKSK